MKLVNKKKFNSGDILKMGEMYNHLTHEIQFLEKQRKELSNKIKEDIIKIGVKDDTGSYYIEDESFIVGKVAKKSMKLDTVKAIQTLKNMGLNSLIETVETVNEDELQNALNDGLISLDAIESFIDTKVNYSILVKKKEDLPEIETAEVQVARYKKNGKL